MSILIKRFIKLVCIPITFKLDKSVSFTEFAVVLYFKSDCKSK